MSNIIRFPVERRAAAVAVFEGEVADSFVAKECRMFWSMCADLRRAASAGRRRAVSNCLDEIGAVQMHTQQAALRKMASEILCQFGEAPVARSA